ncbi:MAG: transcriptional repressor NrdR [Kofleriaceae bacterium]|nr:transcriptional repressor NrdR [Kofleriaceae bacterium]
MRCPFCTTSEDKVIDSRTSKDGREIRRRRECLQCDRRFTTYERIEEALPVVIKADKRREPFDRNKIEKGLRRAIGKRPVSMAKISELAERVEKELTELGVKELRSADIGARILPLLREVDEVSYVRFASIYRDFRDIDEFVEELSDVIKARKR